MTHSMPVYFRLNSAVLQIEMASGFLYSLPPFELFISGLSLKFLIPVTLRSLGLFGLSLILPCSYKELYRAFSAHASTNRFNETHCVLIGENFTLLALILDLGSFELPFFQ